MWPGVSRVPMAARWAISPCIHAEWRPGHEVLRVLRDCCSGEVLLARSLLGATEEDLVPLLAGVAAVCQGVEVPIAGVSTDGQHSLRKAGALPGVPHQLCHFQGLIHSRPGWRRRDTIPHRLTTILTTPRTQESALKNEGGCPQMRGSRVRGCPDRAYHRASSLRKPIGTECNSRKFSCPGISFFSLFKMKWSDERYPQKRRLHETHFHQ